MCTLTPYFGTVILPHYGGRDWGIEKLIMPPKIIQPQASGRAQIQTQEPDIGAWKDATLLGSLAWKNRQGPKEMAPLVKVLASHVSGHECG